MTNLRTRIFGGLWVAAVLLAAVVMPASLDAAEKLNALIIDGRNNHNWKQTTPILKQSLESSGRFNVDVATAPEGEAFKTFNPSLEKYDVLVSNYNGPMWSEEFQKSFTEFVKQGGGLVIVHAANNSFPKWEEYNAMIGVGGWGGRNEKSGPYVRYRDGEIVRDTQPGRGGSHGRQHQFVVTTRDEDHPIMKGLPTEWMHTQDELYDRLRGPAKNLTVLATAYADTKTGGSGEHEPILMTIKYGEGRVFHTVLGHAAEAMSCVGFRTTLNRGTEWAATGEVTLGVPDDFPTADAVSTREVK